MKRKILLISLIMIMLLTVGTVLAAEKFCEDTFEITAPCLMVTPVIANCANYTYEVYNETQSVQNGSLGLLKDQIYKFSFNISKSGDYVVRLCDNSTREVYVKEEDTMLATAITILSLVGFFLFMGFVNRNNALKFASFSLAFIELAFMTGLLFIKESGADVTGLLKINFYVISIIGLGMLLYSIYSKSLILMAFEDPDKDEDSNWRKGTEEW